MSTTNTPSTASWLRIIELLKIVHKAPAADKDNTTALIAQLIHPSTLDNLDTDQIVELKKMVLELLGKLPADYELFKPGEIWCGDLHSLMFGIKQQESHPEDTHIASQFMSLMKARPMTPADWSLIMRVLSMVSREMLEKVLSKKYLTPSAEQIAVNAGYLSLAEMISRSYTDTKTNELLANHGFMVRLPQSDVEKEIALLEMLHAEIKNGSPPGPVHDHLISGITGRYCHTVQVVRTANLSAEIKEAWLTWLKKHNFTI